MEIIKYFRSPEYLFHGTREKNIASIQQDGLDPKYSSQKLVFLSNSPGFSIAWGGFETVIRIDKSKLDPSMLSKSARYPWEYQYSGVIPPELLNARQIIKNQQ